MSFFSSKLAAVLRKLHSVSAAESIGSLSLASDQTSKPESPGVDVLSPSNEFINSACSPRENFNQLNSPSSDNSFSEQSGVPSEVKDESVKVEDESVISDKVNSSLFSLYNTLNCDRTVCHIGLIFFIR